MASPLYLTLLAGPVEAFPVPKPVIDAFVSAEITESASEPSGFQLTFTLADDSILQTLLLLAGDSPIPVLRVILVVTFAGLPQVVMDGVIEHHEVVPDATSGSSKLVVSGRDLSVLMDLIPFTGLPYPGTTPDARAAVILAKYAALGVVPEIVPALVPDIPVPVERIPVQHGTDLAYLKEIAEDVGYVFYLTPGLLPGTTQAYWGPQVRIGIPQPALNVNLDAWTNVESLSFRYQPQASVLPIVFIQDPVAGMTVPVPIPPVTPFNPPLGLAVPVPQKVTYPGDTANMTGRGADARHRRSGRARRRRHRQRHPERRPVRADPAGPQPGGGARRRAGLRRDVLRRQLYPQPQARRVQAELRAQAQCPDLQPPGRTGPSVLRGRS